MAKLFQKIREGIGSTKGNAWWDAIKWIWKRVWPVIISVSGGLLEWLRHGQGWQVWSVFFGTLTICLIVYLKRGHAKESAHSKSPNVTTMPSSPILDSVKTGTLKIGLADRPVYTGKTTAEIEHDKAIESDKKEREEKLVKLSDALRMLREYREQLEGKDPDGKAEYEKEYVSCGSDSRYFHCIEIAQSIILGCFNHQVAERFRNNANFEDPNPESKYPNYERTKLYLRQYEMRINRLMDDLSNNLNAL